jgi:radical SAM superfamily enzyme YgiQ (UPF0313 family)
MKVLFVYTNINVMGQGERSYHFGIGILSAVLKEHGHQTSLYCMYHDYDVRPLLKKIDDFKPQILALTTDSTQFFYVRKILREVKTLGLFTIIGGPHPSLYPDCLKETDGLQAICRGEGEGPLLDLAEALEKKGDIYHIPNLNFKLEDGRILQNPPRPFIPDLDKLPFCDRDLFDYQKVIESDFGRASFMLSRGCPYSCTYCASPSMGKLQQGRYVRFMSVERAIAELKYLKKKYRFKSIFFADDTFTLDKEYVYKFCQQYKKHINIPFEVNSRVESSSLEIFKVLKDAGCFKVHMGIESGHEEFRKNVLNRRMSNEQIINAFEYAREAGLRTKSYNIVGFPYETPQIHQATVELNRKINPDGHVCYIFQPYPGTKLYDICKEERFINPQEDKNVISRRETTLNMPQFTPKEIIRAHRNFSFQIYKNKSLRKALIYKLYYSRYGEVLLRIFSPLKSRLRKLAMN